MRAFEAFNCLFNIGVRHFEHACLYGVGEVPDEGLLDFAGDNAVEQRVVAVGCKLACVLRDADRRFDVMLG